MIPENLEPSAIFKYFDEISRIPRGSGNEEKIADYLACFAKERDLDFYRDQYNNVLIYKEASKGRENDPAIMLQGHIDMVCEAAEGVSHDFKNEPIKLVWDSEYISAEGTTLGADDGAAVAMMLALLESDGISHPRLECLFTTDEESGMTGVSNFDFSRCSSKRCINLDSEDEGEAVVSCAGGGDFKIIHTPDTVHFNDKAFEISVSGLRGGHSGADALLGRRNANYVMFMLLSHLYSKKPFGLISVNGGEKHNVITGDCRARITYSDYKSLREDIAEFLADFRTTLSKDDKNMKIRASKCTYDGNAFSYVGTHKIISSVVLAPQGLLSMSNKIEGMADASSNIGAVKTEDGKVSVSYFFRFNTSARYDEYKAAYEACAYLSGAELSYGGYYPCWQAFENNELVRLYKKLYKNQSGKEARVCAIHAGVECGFINEAMGNGAQMISIGPDISDIHTPEERMNIASFTRTFELLCNMLEICH